MRFPPVITLLALAATGLGGVIVSRDDHGHGNNYNDMDDSFNIFKDSAQRFEGAICKDQITTRQFPTLQVPYGFHGGCVRCTFSPLNLTQPHSINS
jgi:hypothetical protein